MAQKKKKCTECNQINHYNKQACIPHNGAMDQINHNVSVEEERLSVRVLGGAGEVREEV